MPKQTPNNKPYAVRALLVKGQKVLLIHHTTRNPAYFNKWTFPGGRLEPGETDPLTALRREIQEELSVDIEVVGRLGRFYSRNGSDYVIFVARPLGTIGPIQKEEVREVAWLTPAGVYEFYRRERLRFGFEMKVISAYLKKFASSC